MTPDDYIRAARVPYRLKPQAFGPWRIRRVQTAAILERSRKFPWSVQFRVLEDCKGIGFPSYTLLSRVSVKTLHLKDESDIVMEDSRLELQKHLPIWLEAKGRVLVTGLGLGCVVRGLLAKREVEHITVVEIDKSILRVVGHEFASNRRVTLIHADALHVRLVGRFDYAWHDLWTDGDTHLQTLHAQLLAKFREQCSYQGAWQFPRWAKRLVKLPLIG